MDSPKVPTWDRLTNPKLQQPGRDDGRERLPEPAPTNAPIPKPAGSEPAAVLHDEIETWVNEGGSGDDDAA